MTTRAPSKIKVCLKTGRLESFDISFCKGKEGRISRDSVLKPWERQGMAGFKSVGTSTPDLVGSVASVMMYIVFAPLVAGVLMVKHGGRSP